MPRYDPDRHHRNSIRLRSHDYSQSGAYFVTIYTQDRQLFFEDSHLATIVQVTWDNLLAKFPTIVLDTFVVMPNHMHGVIWLHPQYDRRQTSKPETTDTLLKRPRWNPLTPALGEVVRSFKALSTPSVRRQHSYTSFAWQRNYYEHVIRTEQALQAVRQYIENNPKRWEFDHYNPQCAGIDAQSQTLAELLRTDSNLNQDQDKQKSFEALYNPVGA